MKKDIYIFFIGVVYCFLPVTSSGQNGKVGINTTTPQAMLHVKDSAVIFTGPGLFLPAQPGDPPVTGFGARMMWYPQKAAFRVGHLDSENSSSWDKDSIGSCSFAAGRNTKAIGINSVAIGNRTKASGTHSIAMGSSSTATGFMSISLGQLSNALESYSTAIGLGATALGESSIAFSGCTTSGDYTAALGRTNSSRAYASFIIGRYNDSVSSSSRTTWVDTDPVFVIGNGTTDNDRNNALVVLKNAKTGINTSSPNAMLHILPNGASGGGYHSKAALIIEDNTDAFIQLSNPSADESGILSGSNVSNLRSGIVFRADSAISFRTGGNDTKMLLSKTGDVTIDGTLTQNSDVRLKKNIQPLQNSLQKILALKGYHYNWIDKSSDAKLQTGILAQEIEKQMPELVKTSDEGIKSVNYNGMIPYLIEAIKELKHQNEILKKEIQLLKRN